MNPERLDRKPPAATAFVGRQPIFDGRQDVYGYELLFRSSDVNMAGQLDGNKATAQVVYNTLIEIGLDDLVGPNLAFINFPRELLMNGLADLLPPDRVVLEILEDVEVDDELIKSISQLADRGFTIALDDFIFKPKWEPLIELAGIIKLDVFEQSIEAVQEHFDRLKKYDVKLLAEKVETRDEYDALKTIGFDYFQGYFFCKPYIVKKEKPPDNHIAILELLSRLQDPEVDIGEVETLISQTVSLNFKLFRYINSASFGLSRKLDSIHQAVVYFGLQRLKNLACLIAMTDINDKSSELITVGLIRAKMCELLAKTSRQPEPDVFFVVGLFSILDALLDLPLDEILETLPLSEEIIGALVHGEGRLAEALTCSRVCEQCIWPEIRFAKLDITVIYEAYIESIAWARAVSADLSLS